MTGNFLNTIKALPARLTFNYISLLLIFAMVNLRDTIKLVDPILPGFFSVEGSRIIAGLLSGFNVVMARQDPVNYAYCKRANFMNSVNI